MQEMVTALMVMGIVFGSFIFVGWMIWMISRTRRERQQNEIELRSRMLEKFGTSDEFVGFMQTDAGKKFLETASSKSGKTWRTRIASSLSSGAILIMLGLAFFCLSWLVGTKELMFPGLILSAIGLGLVVSAYVYSRVARSGIDDGIYQD